MKFTAYRKYAEGRLIDPNGNIEKIENYEYQTNNLRVVEKEIENANPGRKAWITDTRHEKVVIDIPVGIAKSYLVEGDL